MLRSDLCDYSDAYIVVKGDITVSAGDEAHNRDRKSRSLAFKNNTPFTSCISKINSVLIENSEDLDIVMPMYNLLQYSKNYSETSGSLWNYYRDEPNNPPANNYHADPITNSGSFKYKSSIIGKTPNNENENNNVIENVGIVVPLKHLSNFWRTLDMPLTNCEVSLTLTCSKNCVLTDIIKRAADPNADLPVEAINAPTNATFKIKDTKLYGTVVTLSAENDNKLSEQLKIGLKKTIKSNKYRSEMSNKARNNNLNYLIDPTFTNVNRLFVLSFKNDKNDDDQNESVRTYFKIYYVPKVEVKDFHVLIDGKQFSEIPVKNKEEAHEQIIEMSKNNDYKTCSLLDYEYFSKHYKLIAIDSRKQIELENPDLKQQINFIGRLEEDATMFFIIEKKRRNHF